jgi:hypothetical protein
VDRLNRSLSSGLAISPKMGAVETPLVVRPDNEGWSLYGAGAQRLQPVATGGKCESAGNGSDNRKPVPWAATDCLRRSMVRRESTVRVRQRALQKRRTSALFRSDGLAPGRTCGGMEPFIEPRVGDSRQTSRQKPSASTGAAKRCPPRPRSAARFGTLSVPPPPDQGDHREDRRKSSVCPATWASDASTSCNRTAQVEGREGEGRVGRLGNRQPHAVRVTTQLRFVVRSSSAGLRVGSSSSGLRLSGTARIDEIVPAESGCAADRCFCITSAN